jgi:hypothetical protein
MVHGEALAQVLASLHQHSSSLDGSVLYTSWHRNQLRLLVHRGLHLSILDETPSFQMVVKGPQLLFSFFAGAKADHRDQFNFVLSASLEGGTLLSGLFIFVTLQLPKHGTLAV